MSCGCVVILGGSTAEKRKEKDSEGMGSRRGIATSDTRPVQAQTICMLLGGPLNVAFVCSKKKV